MATAISVLATVVVGLFTWNSITPHNAVSTHTVPATRSVLCAEQLLEKHGNEGVKGKEEEKKRKEDVVDETIGQQLNGIYASPAPFIAGQRMWELTREELAQIGIQVNDSGVWNFYREGDSAYGYGLSPTITYNVSAIDRHKEAATAITPFPPTVVTDGFGNRRIEFFDREERENHLVAASAAPSVETHLPRWRVLDEDLQRKLALYFRSQGNPIENNSSYIITGYVNSMLNQPQVIAIESEQLPGLILGGSCKIQMELGTILYQDIVGKQYQHQELEPIPYKSSMRLLAANYPLALLPIRVRSNTVANSTTDLQYRDFIFWYELTPEFLAALPERVQRYAENRFVCRPASDRPYLTTRQSFDLVQKSEDEKLLESPTKQTPIHNTTPDILLE